MHHYANGKGWYLMQNVCKWFTRRHKHLKTNYFTNVSPTEMTPSGHTIHPSAIQIQKLHCVWVWAMGIEGPPFINHNASNSSNTICLKLAHSHSMMLDSWILWCQTTIMMLDESIHILGRSIAADQDKFDGQITVEATQYPCIIMCVNHFLTLHGTNDISESN